MNKAKIVEIIAKEAGITQKEAKIAFEATFEAILTGVKKGNVSVPKFGTFKISARKARTGVNPATGAKLQIPASKAFTFKQSSVVKERFNK